MEEYTSNSLGMLTSNEIKKIIPYSLNHIRRLEVMGCFPNRVRIGGNRVIWIRDEVEAWLQQRVKQRDATLLLKIEKHSEVKLDNQK